MVLGRPPALVGAAAPRARLALLSLLHSVARPDSASSRLSVDPAPQSPAPNFIRCFIFPSLGGCLPRDRMGAVDPRDAELCRRPDTAER